MRFSGQVKTGIGKFSELGIPGRCNLANAPPDWPDHLCPGSLNIKVNDDGYPPELSRLNPKTAIKALDAGLLLPAFSIPHGCMCGNRLVPTEQNPMRGTAQVWRATLTSKRTGAVCQVWVLRRIDSRLGQQLELVAETNLRAKMSLSDGDSVDVEMFAGNGRRRSDDP